MKNSLEMFELVVLNPGQKGSKGTVVTTVTRFAESISAAVKQTRYELSSNDTEEKKTNLLVLQKAAIEETFNRLSGFARLSDRPARGRRWANPRRKKELSVA